MTTAVRPDPNQQTYSKNMLVSNVELPEESDYLYRYLLAVAHSYCIAVYNAMMEEEKCNDAMMALAAACSSTWQKDATATEQQQPLVSQGWHHGTCAVRYLIFVGLRCVPKQMFAWQGMDKTVGCDQLMPCWLSGSRVTQCANILSAATMLLLNNECIQYMQSVVVVQLIQKMPCSAFSHAQRKFV